MVVVETGILASLWARYSKTHGGNVPPVVYAALTAGAVILATRFVKYELTLRRRRHAAREKPAAERRLHTNPEQQGLVFADEDPEDEPGIDEDDDDFEEPPEPQTVAPVGTEARLPADAVPESAPESPVHPQRLLSLPEGDASTEDPPTSPRKSTPEALSQAEIMFLRSNVNVFRYLDRHTVRLICSMLDCETVVAGRTIFSKGDIMPALYIVTKGTVRLYIDSPTGGEIHLCDIRDGESLTSLLCYLEAMVPGAQPTPCHVTARAVTDTELISLRIEDFRSLAEQFPAKFVNIAQVIMVRLQRVTFLTLYRYLGLTHELVIDDPVDDVAPPADLSSQTDPGFADATMRLVASVLGIPVQVAVAEIGDSVEVVALGKDEAVLEEKEDSGGLYVVLKGALDVHMREGQGVRRMYRVSTGGVVGHLAALTGDQSEVFAVAAQATTVACIPRSAFSCLVERHPLVAIHVAQSLISKLSPLVRQFDFALDWVYERAGSVLVEENGDVDGLYIVLHGRLRATKASTSGKPIFVEEFGRGVSVGELELLTDTKAPATITATRDTELCKIPRETFRMLTQRFPRLMAHFALAMGKRLEMQYTRGLAKPAEENLATVAVVAMTSDVPLSDIADRLVSCLERIGTALLISRDTVAAQFGERSMEGVNKIRLAGWLGQQEEDHNVVVYETDKRMSTWTRRCIRQADLILLVGFASNGPYIGDIEKQLQRTIATSNARKELVLLYREHEQGPNNTMAWAEARAWTNGHHHVRLHKQRNFDVNHFKSDFGRLARRIRGKLVGLVLGGGGAKGLAHVGVLKVLEENGIPIDMVGGTSIGAFIGGLYAMHRDADIVAEMVEDYCASFADRVAILRDVTVPFTSFTSGEQFNRLIRRFFLEKKIEDMWLPYFCTTTNITKNRPEFHQQGTAWRFIRASMTLISFLPPICDGPNYLVDGGYANVLPADIMRSQGARTVIAIHVATEDDTNYYNYGDSLSGWWLLWKRINPFAKPVNIPSMSDISTRMCYLKSDLNLDFVKENMIDLYMRPPVNNYPLLGFGLYEEISKVGYTHAKATIDKWREENRIPELLVYSRKRRRGSLLSLLSIGAGAAAAKSAPANDGRAA